MVETIRPVGPVRPAKPVGPVRPAKPVGPVRPAKPVGPVRPAKPVGPVRPAKPVSDLSYQSCRLTSSILNWFPVTPNLQEVEKERRVSQARERDTLSRTKRQREHAILGSQSLRCTLSAGTVATVCVDCTWLYLFSSISLSVSGEEAAPRWS